MYAFEWTIGLLLGAMLLAALAMRRSGEIGDDAFHVLEEEFDWAELSAAG